jgi:hypothetical protein
MRCDEEQLSAVLLQDIAFGRVEGTYVDREKGGGRRKRDMIRDISRELKPRNRHACIEVCREGTLQLL